jgi:hypothetical protein
MAVMLFAVSFLPRFDCAQRSEKRIPLPSLTRAAPFQVADEANHSARLIRFVLRYYFSKKSKTIQDDYTSFGSFRVVQLYLDCR